MYWSRRHHRSILRLTLLGWVLAVAVMAFQGCLALPEHNIAVPHDIEQHMTDGHALHASGCLQNCEDTAIAIKPTFQTSALIYWIAFLLLTAAVILVLTPEEKSSFATLVLKRPAPPEGPVHLTFVRFND